MKKKIINLSAKIIKQLMKKFLFAALLLNSLNLFSQYGDLDSTFGTGGKVVTSINSGADKAYSVALQPDGKIIVAGMTTNSLTGQDFVCIRYNSDGTFDNTFGTNGIFTNDFQTGSDDVVYSLALQSDGKIVLAGYSDDGSNKNAAILRLNANGTIDTTFGNSGKILTDFITGKADEIKVIKIHPLTGALIVGGTSATSTTQSQAVIARYNSTGTLDTTFNTTGIYALPHNTGSGTFYYVIEDLVVKPNGKITAVGWINQQGLQWSANHMAYRLNSNGSLDTSFSTDGVITVNGNFNADDKSFSMLLNADDSFLFSGGGNLTSTKYDYFLGLYNATGTSVIGKAFFDYGTLINDIAYGMGVDSTGKIVMAGSSVTSTTSSTFGISRVNADYTIDNSFGSSGKVTTTFGTNTTNEAFDMAIQPDDKIIAVGYTGNDIAIARYTGGILATNESSKISTTGKIYPNPVKTTINISEELTKQDSSFNIYSLDGKLLLKGNAQDNKINVQSLMKGIYFIRIGNNQVIKFIKD
ncbi:T9SS type A sorting domain-containing protein [Chryseobacterium sp. Y16C]|uniref:T9SS type A sorting domain-containing protein n=1 Tax=Chryseobacterium sp. Y16C TaxID=2920939 RepID=UPI001F0AE340|nr:T9SS type A sorting domain-containing protein [Chryseobacterium sp. Y16C]UMQ41108.1 T9SS type A sorting domain-containing protein [Chryseobacterium sp. Y16C]